MEKFRNHLILHSWKLFFVSAKDEQLQNEDWGFQPVEELWRSPTEAGSMLCNRIGIDGFPGINSLLPNIANYDSARFF
jgi:hypothetical protein